MVSVTLVFRVGLLTEVAMIVTVALAGTAFGAV
jgi:hypothetical protein